MNRWQKLTLIIIVGTAAALIGYDIFAVTKDMNATISLVITTASYRHPMIPFAFGVLMGHFFFQNS